MISYSEKVNLMVLHALAGAMLSTEIEPVDESFEYWDCGQYRIFKLQGIAEKHLESDVVSQKLHDFFKSLSKLYPRFEVYEVSPYGCFNPDLGLMVLMVSICHTA